MYLWFALGLHCCSKWFGQLSSRISKCRTNRRFISEHDVIHCLWIGKHWFDCGLSDHNWLRSIHRAISLCHCSKFRHVSRKTLHRWSLCAWRKLVLNYIRSNAAIMLKIALCLDCTFSVHDLLFSLLSDRGTARNLCPEAPRKYRIFFVITWAWKHCN